MTVSRQISIFVNSLSKNIKRYNKYTQSASLGWKEPKAVCLFFRSWLKRSKLRVTPLSPSRHPKRQAVYRVMFTVQHGRTKFKSFVWHVMSDSKTKVEHHPTSTIRPERTVGPRGDRYTSARHISVLHTLWLSARASLLFLTGMLLPELDYPGEALSSSTGSIGNKLPVFSDEKRQHECVFADETLPIHPFVFLSPHATQSHA